MLHSFLHSKGPGPFPIWGKFWAVSPAPETLIHHVATVFHTPKWRWLKVQTAWYLTDEAHVPQAVSCLPYLVAWYRIWTQPKPFYQLVVSLDHNNLFAESGSVDHLYTIHLQKSHCRTHRASVGQYCVYCPTDALCNVPAALHSRRMKSWRILCISLHWFVFYHFTDPACHNVLYRRPARCCLCWMNTQGQRRGPDTAALSGDLRMSWAKKPQQICLQWGGQGICVSISPCHSLDMRVFQPLLNPPSPSQSPPSRARLSTAVV